MSDLIGFVISIALIYIGLKVTFKFIKWIGILMIVLCIFKMIAFIQASSLIDRLYKRMFIKERCFSYEKVPLYIRFQHLLEASFIVNLPNSMDNIIRCTYTLFDSLSCRLKYDSYDVSSKRNCAGCFNRDFRHCQYWTHIT